MKIYFAGSIKGGRNDAAIYSKLIEELQKYGEVLTEHLGLSTLSNNGESKTSEFIYKRDMDWLRAADIVIAEVSTPSLGVGYELGFAENLNKRVICLYRNNAEKKLSAMIEGNQKFEIFRYSSLEEVKSYFNKSLTN